MATKLPTTTENHSLLKLRRAYNLLLTEGIDITLDSFFYDKMQYDPEPIKKNDLWRLSCGCIVQAAVGHALYVNSEPEVKCRFIQIGKDVGDATHFFHNKIFIGTENMVPREDFESKVYI